MANREKCIIRVGSTDIETTMDLAHHLGYEAPYANDAEHLAREMSGFLPSRGDLVAVALSEGLTGEAAVLRAIALLNSGSAATSAERCARLTLDAADKQLHAARVERQAAMLNCRARGVSDKIDGE